MMVLVVLVVRLFARQCLGGRRHCSRHHHRRRSRRYHRNLRVHVTPMLLLLVVLRPLSPLGRDLLIGLRHYANMSDRLSPRTTRTTTTYISASGD